MSMSEKPERFRKWMPVLIGCSGLFVASVLLAGVVMLFLLAEGMLVQIEPTERGVVVSLYEPKGYRLPILEPGYHLLRPGEEVVIYDISRHTYTMSDVSDTQPDSVKARTSDGQDVAVGISVVYAVDPEKILEIHQVWQYQYEAGVVRPTTRSLTRNTIIQYTAEEVVGDKRAEAQEIIAGELKTKLAEQHLLLIDFTIQDIRLIR